MSAAGAHGDMTCWAGESWFANKDPFSCLSGLPQEFLLLNDGNKNGK